MVFNGGKVSIECKEYVPVAGQSVIEVSSEQEFTLAVKTNYAWGEYQFRILPGKTELRV